jgi:hypothetical protein
MWNLETHFTKIHVKFVSDISPALNMKDLSPLLSLPELGSDISSTPAAMVTSPRLDYFQKLMLLPPHQI